LYFLNKVRKLPNKTLYEVVKYNIEKSLGFHIYSVGRDELKTFLTKDVCDFGEENGYLISTAETMSTSLFGDKDTRIQIGKNLFDLLIDLVRKEAFFLPASIFNDNIDHYAEHMSHFSNIRVSSSTMYVGFSIFYNGGWSSSKILDVASGELKCKPFYVALPADSLPKSDTLRLVGAAKINGKECNYYVYDNTLPIFGDVYPALYLPLPIFNYLNLQYSRCLNAHRFLSDVFETKGILPSSTPYSYRVPERAITVSSSIKNTPKNRRLELLCSYKDYKGDLSDFVRDYNLNSIEHYAFSLLSKIPKLRSTGDIANLMKLLKINRSIYALALMMMRCHIFSSPDLFFPAHCDSILARGGGGGDAFVTLLASNNY